jgi:hypothetical protein
MEFGGEKQNGPSFKTRETILCVLIQEITTTLGVQNNVSLHAESEDYFVLS